jgi:hypothetical protein
VRLADAVTAAVADVPDDHLAAVAREHDRDDGRAHARLVLRSTRAAEHVLVGQAHADDDAVLFFGEVVVVGKWPGAVGADGVAVELFQRGDRERAGDVARQMATHAVRHSREPVLGEHQKGVLVPVAQQADIGPAREQRANELLFGPWGRHGLEAGAVVGRYGTFCAGRTAVSPIV